MELIRRTVLVHAVFPSCKIVYPTVPVFRIRFERKLRTSSKILQDYYFYVAFSHRKFKNKNK